MSTTPRATYRLQLHRGFTFDDAAQIVPYLAELGISHCYCSPYLKARAGSTHGYDIVDHNALNPEIGDEAGLDRFVAALHAHGMGQILDIVPNHMAVGGDDNAWWLDVLENGPASPYAGYFDIDWRPVKEELRGRVLLPVLPDHYGKVLEDGALRLEYDAQRGEFSVRFYEHRFPVDPGTYPLILVDGGIGPEGGPLRALHELVAAFRQLPDRRDLDPQRRELRRRDMALLKARLAALGEQSAVAVWLGERVEAFNGRPGEPGSFDDLHRLLEAQPYRLAYWQVAADEINYRRFFDINTLAGLRVEAEEVFEATHHRVLELVAQGVVDGLRVDHPDGLYDPAEYYRRLQQRLQAVSTDASGVYLVAEKILAAYEHLPTDWAINGTTGYEFSAVVNGLFVDPGAERRLDRLYARFLGRPADFDELLYERKRLVIRAILSSELMVLANLLDRIAESDRYTRDYTLNGLREALTEIVACFPVYRTYLTPGQVSEQDRRFLQWAVAQAKRRSPASDISIFDFIHRLLLFEGDAELPAAERFRRVQFVMRLQQYTAPVTAKALEDTALYSYNRLVSLNEVGGDPRNFGASPAAFHHANLERAQHWPQAMLATSTHDSKRSEDVRARLDVLSELPEQWRRQLARWSQLSRARKREVDGRRAPSRNDEYLLYQSLLGAWPLEPLDEAGLAALRERITAYMLKAIKEAKVHTSWINPNPEYEAAMAGLVDSLLSSPENAFVHSFAPFAQRIARFGLYNSLSQVLLKLTAPGVPDVYQGNELWTFALVDPDNRRPVDYGRRRGLLDAIRDEVTGAPDLGGWVRGLLDTLDDGRAKLYLTWRVLNFRREQPALFRAGGYQPLTVEGPRAEHLVAFARIRDGEVAIAIAARFFARLLGEGEGAPVGALWADTWIALPDQAVQRPLHNVLTGAVVEPALRDGAPVLAAAAVLDRFPVALFSG